MKAVADTLGVVRSHLAERLSRPARPRSRYHKSEDARLLPTIRAIVDARRRDGRFRATLVEAVPEICCLWQDGRLGGLAAGA